ncbi:hypothetical protein LINPERPRIM_LOCUS24109 [Linum perenne]
MLTATVKPIPSRNTNKGTPYLLSLTRVMVKRKQVNQWLV